MRGRRLLPLGLGLLLVAAVAAGAWWVVRRGPVGPAPTEAVAMVDPDTMRLVPEGVRIKVELLNATGVRGLARRVAPYLRDRGFDVVTIGDAPVRDTSLVLDRSGHPEWAAWAARAMQGATIEARPDSVRYLDLTVLIGRSFRAPSQVLYP
jgi:hypothetical protein